MLYGCCEAARDKFLDRLESCDFAFYHPLTLPTIFAEIERNRHFDLVNSLITKLVERVETLHVANEQQDDPEQSPDGQPSTSSEDSSKTDEAPEAYIKLWLQISWLKNGLENWRRQLQKMIAHGDELRQARFHIPNSGFESSGDSTPFNSNFSADVFDEKGEETCTPHNRKLSNLEDAGSRIHRKLLELLEEYEEKIEACATIIEGMALAAQLVSQKTYAISK